MKKQITLIILFLVAFISNAQTNPTATVTASLILSDVISIEATQSDISFVYDTAEAYLSDQTVNGSNLVVTSTKNFSIDVKAGGENFISGTRSIPVNVLTIKPASGGNMSGTQNEIELTNQTQQLVQAAALGSNVTLYLDYFIPGTKSSSPDILGKSEGTYVQTITYTAIAL